MTLEPGAAVQVLETVDVVFPVLHGRFGEDGTIQGMLEMAGIPYVGAGVFASAAAMDKEFTKILVRGAGLDVGEFEVLRRGRPYSSVDLRHLGLPVFVKPARAGSSVGITKVDDWADLDEAIEVAFGHDTKVLVEAAVVGREIECGVLEDEHGRPEASLPAEIRVVRGHEWYDFEAKYLDDACEFDIPATLSPRSPRRSARRRAGCSPRSTAPGWRASTSSSRPTTGSWSTRSTPCPDSRPSRCSRRCGRRPASTIRRSSTAWCRGAAPRELLTRPR